MERVGRCAERMALAVSYPFEAEKLDEDECDEESGRAEEEEEEEVLGGAAGEERSGGNWELEERVYLPKERVE